MIDYNFTVYCSQNYDPRFWWMFHCAILFVFIYTKKLFLQGRLDGEDRSDRTHSRRQPSHIVSTAAPNKDPSLPVYCCSQCPFFTSTRDHFQRHLRTHGQEKPYACPYCPRRFDQSGYLKYHIRTHTGERPFLCSVCSQSFTRNTYLKKHTLIHHSQ